MNHPDRLLTIVVPVHNRASLVCRTLDSIAAQAVERPFTLVVVDNGSTDGSYATVHRWADAHRQLHTLLLTENTPGACAARNRGLAEVKSPWVMFFDSDDIMLPGHIASLQQAIERHPQADIVGWPVLLRSLDGSEAIKPFYAHDALYHNIMHGSMGTQRWAARTDLVRRAGGWDQSVMGWNDIELGTRMLLLSPQIVQLKPKHPAVVEIATAESITGTTVSAAASRYDHSCDCMAEALSTVGLSRRAELKRTILAGCCCAEGSKDLARELLGKALGRTPSAFHRLLLRGAYAYRAVGLRGIARLLRPFF